MSEQQIKEMVVTNIIDNCTVELDKTGRDRYYLNEKQFGKCIDTLVKSIKAIQCCKNDNEQLKCPDCKQPFTKEELQVKEHCCNCGKEF